MYAQQGFLNPSRISGYIDNHKVPKFLEDKLLYVGAPSKFEYTFIAKNGGLVRINKTYMVAAIDGWKALGLTKGKFYHVMGKVVKRNVVQAKDGTLSYCEVKATSVS